MSMEVPKGLTVIIKPTQFDDDEADEVIAL